MMPHPLVQKVLDDEPGIGSGDESKCLPGWIDSFCKWFEEGKGTTLSHDAVRALAHTLIAAQQRAKRLATERDARRPM